MCSGYLGGFDLFMVLCNLFETVAHMGDMRLPLLGIVDRPGS